MYLTSDQRKSLMQIAVLRDARRRMAEIDAFIARLRHENPHAFHTVTSLEERVFFHAPSKDIPHLAAVKPHAQAAQDEDESAA
ncbi:hypothetical protein [Caballeronia concitans]|uniref:hypothetical protein n=1 Tax=Caballeronia concitans TaxID=1777133 RepID=UPI001FCA54F4|nr:hypothetical protein [Caballeronia concitans]